ncbi:HtaA domain-containing protein [Streptomyces zagrosensis]|uniref:Htaa domain-containing protein n=1 Tax=Streptomyces zagrosensis TaxID=1042984 RepID=A0A7W9UW89_9ACTN|nr:HtaA domain-containing protein [Streptomyces zagrosensis]MBB5933287.1 hypothetical protein [Streptomyces zagrosensis]
MSLTSSAPRRTRRTTVARAAATATAFAFGAAALSLPAAAYATGDEGKVDAPPKVVLKNGTLDWGVKESFREYVVGPIADGKITVAGGAKQAANNGPFTFVNGTGTYDTGSHAVATAFQGSVRFTGHGKQLDLELSDLKVNTEQLKGAITADFRSKDKESGEVTEGNDVGLADLDLTGIKPGTGDGGAMEYANIPSTLTEAGAKVFGAGYEPGTKLDPATLTVTPGGPVPPDPTTPPPTTPPPTPSTTPPTTAPPTPSTTPPTTPPTGGPSPSPTTGQPAESGVIVAGDLDWGVKEGFRTYITGPMANGKVALSGGAKKQGEIYRFPKGSGTYDASSKALDAKFAGAVRFTGHQGKLDLKFSDLTVKASGSKGTLVADISSKDKVTGKVTRTNDQKLAHLALPTGDLTAVNKVISLKNVPATLTAGGAKAFGGYYQAGEQLDPVTLAVSLDKNASLPPVPPSTGGNTATTPVTQGQGGGGVTGGGTTGGSGSLAATGSDVPTGVLLGAAGVLVAGGAAATFAVRRRSSAATATAAES